MGARVVLREDSCSGQKETGHRSKDRQLRKGALRRRLTGRSAPAQLPMLAAPYARHALEASAPLALPLLDTRRGVLALGLLW
jgi:hypothetical protein